MSQTRTRRLTVEFEGASDDGHLQLKDFIDILEQLKVLLGDVERSVRRNAGVLVEYRVVALSHNSPAKIGIEERVVARKGRKDPIGLSTVQVSPTVIGQFKRVGAPAFKPTDADFDTLLAMEDLVGFVGPTAKSITLTSGRSKVALTSAFKRRFERFLGPDLVTLGTVQGTLEGLDLHHKHRCVVYPVLGPTKVRVDFPERLKLDVLRAVERRVRFAGQIAYKSFSPFPYRMHADALEVLPEDHELPTLGQLKGLFGDAYEEVGAEHWMAE